MSMELVADVSAQLAQFRQQIEDWAQEEHARNPDIAQSDIVSELNLHLIQNPDRFPPTVQPADGWWRPAAQEVVARLRGTTAPVLLAPLPSGVAEGRSGAATEVARADAVATLNRDLGAALADLPFLEASCVRMFHFDGLDWCQIAAALRLPSEDAARELGLGALEKLRQRLRMSKYLSS